MKLKNFLLVVHDIELSKSFYKDLFGLSAITDFGENVILTEGLVLQEQKSWQALLKKETHFGGHDAELYFEESDFDSFVEKLEKSDFSIEYLNKCTERDWGQRVIRIYDPDRHVIEIAESPEHVARRLLHSGMTVEEVAQKTRLPIARIEVMQSIH